MGNTWYQNKQKLLCSNTEKALFGYFLILLVKDILLYLVSLG